MRFSSNRVGLSVECNECQPLVIIIENENTFVQLVSDIKGTVEGLDECVIVSSGDNQYKLQKESEVIIDPWSVDCNSKTIKNKLYQLLNETSQEFQNEDFLQLRTSIFTYIENLSEHIPYAVSYNIDIESLAIYKSIDLSIQTQNQDMIENLVEYMKLLRSLCGVKIVFFINIKSFLSEERLLLLYKEAQYIDMQLICIEGQEKNYNSFEKTIIIDKNNCIIDV